MAELAPVDLEQPRRQEAVGGANLDVDHIVGRGPARLHEAGDAELGQLPIEPEKQAGMIRRMKMAAWLGVFFAVWTTWSGLRLLR